MIPRVNTLGKSAIIDRRLNSAYDVVEYVADNLPLLIESAHKIQLIANINYVKDHVDNSDIHLSQEDRDKLNAILDSDYVSKQEINQEINNINTSIQNIVSTLGLISTHVYDSTLHLTQEDRETIERISNDLNELQSLKVKVNNLSYNDLLDKPVIDSSLNEFSSNAVENKAITKALNDKVNRTALHNVAFTGNYAQLNNKPQYENAVVENSTKAITSGAVYKALSNISDINVESIPLSDIQEMFGEQE